MKDNDKGKGMWRLRQYRGGKLIRDEIFPNLTTTEGRNYLLDAGLGGGSVITQWYAGLVDNLGFSGPNIADTMVSHIGWAEYTNYVESTRQAWPPDAAAGGQIQNVTTEMTFTISVDGVIIGAFLTSSNVKGGSTGTLWNMASLITGPLSVYAGDVIQASYGYGLT